MSVDTVVEIKSQEVIRKHTKTDGHTLKQAIAQTIADYGYYFYACEPNIEVSEYDDTVEVHLNKEDIVVGDIIDDDFIIALVKNLEILKDKESE